MHKYPQGALPPQPGRRLGMLLVLNEYLVEGAKPFTCQPMRLNETPPPTVVACMILQVGQCGICTAGQGPRGGTDDESAVVY